MIKYNPVYLTDSIPVQQGPASQAASKPQQLPSSCCSSQPPPRPPSYLSCTVINDSTSASHQHLWCQPLSLTNIPTDALWVNFEWTHTPWLECQCTAVYFLIEAVRSLLQFKVPDVVTSTRSCHYSTVFTYSDSIVPDLLGPTARFKLTDLFTDVAKIGCENTRYPPPVLQTYRFSGSAESDSWIPMYDTYICMLHTGLSF
jgi:hypothetical protein